MQRDMSLVREILLAVERSPHGLFMGDLYLNGVDSETVGYHVHLLGEAGLLKVLPTTTMASKSPQAIPLSLTWQGHEFLDLARSESIWKRTLEKFGETGSGLAIDLLKRYLSQAVAAAIGIDPDLG